MTLSVGQTTRFKISGPPDEIMDLLTRVLDLGAGIDFEMMGWSDGGGHIEAKATLLIKPNCETSAAMVKLLLP